MIAPGEVIAEVVPQEGRMVADVRISPRDIGHVKVGLPVTIKVQTYDYARYGGIKGRVEYLSAASFVDDRGQPYFSGRIALDASNIGDPARGYVVTPGMTVAADIRTGSKTLMAYLFKPVTNALQTAFSER